MWKKSIESGSPPCSPQIPSFRSALASRPAPRGEPYQPAHARLVDRLERAAVDELLLHVLGQELRLDVVAREAQRRLRQVVRPEREEVGDTGDAIRHEARPWQLDHGADGDVETFP